MSLYTNNQRAKKCVLNLEQAVYHACKSNRGTLGRISEIYGLNYNTLALQINPNRTCHTLAPETIELVLEHTKDSRIMDAICSAHGNACWFELPVGNQSELIDGLIKMGQKFADMNTVMLEAIVDKQISYDEYKSLEKVGFALIGQIQRIVQTAKIQMEDTKQTY